MHSLVISKSRYLAGLQCSRLLWHRCNKPDAFPPIDAATLAFFDQGALVGELAKRLFPKGIEIGAGVIEKGTVDELSRLAVSKRLPMFEAGFSAGRATAQGGAATASGLRE